MGFLQQLLGTDKQANLRKLSVAEKQDFTNWPTFKASYADLDAHTYMNRRKGKDDTFEPLYETTSLDRNTFDRVNASREAICNKLGLIMNAEPARNSFYMDKASYETMVEYQALVRGLQKAQTR